MQKFLMLAIAAAMLAAPFRVTAQDQYSAEAMARIQPGEAGRLDRDSVHEVGDQLSFHVEVTWNDASRPRPAEQQTRVVRFVANCQANTIVVSAVVVVGRDGGVNKTLIAPPGAVDPVTPAAGSNEERWMKSVCRF